MKSVNTIPGKMCEVHHRYEYANEIKYTRKKIHTFEESESWIVDRISYEMITAERMGDR
jgi:hypothetical protein